MSARPEPAPPLQRLRPLLSRLPGTPAWSEWRAAALAQLIAVGLPTTRDDAWKYTNLRLLERRELAPAAPRPLDASTLADLPARQGPRLVYVDGRFHGALSDATLPAGLTLAPYAALLAAGPPPLPAAPVPADERLRLLNACMACDGAQLALAAGAAPEQPLEIVHVATGGGSYPRTRLELGAGAALHLIEYQIGVGPAEAFVAAVSDLVLGRGARLTHTTVQLSGERTVLVDDSAVRVGAEAHYEHRLVALGGQLARLDLHVVLDGAGAVVRLAGVFFADGTREHHIRTLIDHCKPHGTSDQLYRGVAGGRGRGSYDGKVIVRAGAAKTSSRQSSRNLLLTPDASIDTRPQLEINADDVKCAHGATTGTLDEQMLFYLLTRGLDRQTARALLTYAFVGDVLMRLDPAPLRQAIELRALGRLPAADTIREFVA